MSENDTTVDEPEVDSPEEPVEPTTDTGDDGDKGGEGGKPEPEPFDADRAKAKIAKANKEAQSLRQRLKELEPLAAKAKELEDADKSETEKLTERLTAAEKRATEAEQTLLRLQVAAEKGLTPAQAKRLIGSTREELEEDADDLLASFPTPQGTKTARVPGRPKEKPRGGGDPDEPPEEKDPRKLADAIPRRR